VALWNAVSSSRSGFDYKFQRSAVELEKTEEQSTHAALISCTLEAKTPLEDGSDWAGLISIRVHRLPKNRDVTLMIGLTESSRAKALVRRSHFTLCDTELMFDCRD
jgi:hypothetical protein